MKRFIPLIFAILTVLFTSVSFTAYAEDAPSEEHVNFTFDFSNVEDFTQKFGVEQSNEVTITPADGYTTFTATGSDPYIKIGTGVSGDEYSPTGKCDTVDYIVMKYRTTAKIAKGEFFTNHGGQTWGAAGTHVEFDLVNDGEWHTVVIDAHGVWGEAYNDTLYAFRIDPLYSGCKKNDAIDIVYIKFFAEMKYAYEYANPGEIYEVTTEEETTKAPDPTNIVEFYVSGRLVYTVPYAKGQSKLSSEPVVPAIPGMTGKWENYTLDGTNLKVNAVYEYTDGRTVATEPAGDITEKYEVKTLPSEQTSAEEKGETAEVESTADTVGTELVTEAQNSGCSSILSVCMIPIAVTAFAVFKNRKSYGEKED